jgi:16S rRNA (guanine966-N2)-methyltransferase
LFAGSGILGFEALSRGAAHVTFVETDDTAAEWIERNARALGCEAKTEIATADAMRFATADRRTYDLVFADPPYAFGATADIPSLVMRGSLLAPDGYLLIEHHSGLHFETVDGYVAGPEKKFGRTIVTFFRHHTPSTSTDPS